jgi:hypothetical protein
MNVFFTHIPILNFYLLWLKNLRIRIHLKKYSLLRIHFQDLQILVDMIFYHFFSFRIVLSVLNLSFYHLVRYRQLLPLCGKYYLLVEFSTATVTSLQCYAKIVLIQRIIIRLYSRVHKYRFIVI